LLFNTNYIGAFINDPDVNAAVMILKQDKNSDVKQYVQDIHCTIEEKHINLDEFLNTLQTLKRECSVTEEETSDIEKEIKLDQIIEDASSQKN
jgi:hypothetical protein